MYLPCIARDIARVISCLFSLHLVSKLCFDRLLGLQSRVLPFQEVHAYRLLLEQNSGTGFVECSLSPTPSPAIIITWKVCSSYFICEIKCVGECDSMMGSHRFYKLEQLCSVTSTFLERSIDTKLAIKQFRFTCIWKSVIERQGECSSQIGSNSHKLND